MELIQLQILVHVPHVQLDFGLMELGPIVSVVLLDLLVLRVMLDVNPVRTEHIQIQIILAHACLVQSDFGLL